MTPRTVLSLPATLLTATLLLPQDGLQRVQPIEPGTGEAKAARQEEPFRAEEWRRALSGADLDLRERDLDRLLRMARRSDEAWRFLRELRDDASAPELAWTARMALRELEQGRPRVRLFADPGARLADPLSDWSVLLEELHGELGMPGAVPHARGEAGAKGEDRRIRIEHDGQEWRLRITETKDGQETTREFRGPSVEAIVAENPELADELGVFHLGDPDGFRLDMGLPPDGPLGSLFQGLDGFRRLHPSQGFEFRGPDGTPRKLRFFTGPQARSRPARTDVLGVRVEPLTEELAQGLGLASSGGLYVQDSFPGTIAHLLGVKGGDVLLRLQGEPLASAEDITRAMRALQPGQALTLVWLDGRGERVERTWTPEAAEPPADEPAPSARDY